MSGIRTRLAALTLVQRFSLAGGAVMLVSMIIIGSWVTAVISARVVESTGAATALFMDSFIAPLAQELDEADTLSIGPTRALEEPKRPPNPRFALLSGGSSDQATRLRFLLT